MHVSAPCSGEVSAWVGRAKPGHATASRATPFTILASMRSSLLARRGGPDFTASLTRLRVRAK
jgi:hypothetical protein